MLAERLLRSLWHRRGVDHRLGVSADPKGGSCLVALHTDQSRFYRSIKSHHSTGGGFELGQGFSVMVLDMTMVQGKHMGRIVVMAVPGRYHLRG